MAPVMCPQQPVLLQVQAEPTHPASPMDIQAHVQHTVQVGCGSIGAAQPLHLAAWQHDLAGTSPPAPLPKPRHGALRCRSGGLHSTAAPVSAGQPPTGARLCLCRLWYRATWGTSAGAACTTSTVRGAVISTSPISLATMRYEGVPWTEA